MSKDAAPLPDDVVRCHQIIRDLQREVAELEARLNQNSSNSSKPPSSDPPSAKRAPPKRPTGEKCAGQRRHKPHRRDLGPPEKVTVSFDRKLETCLCCGAALLSDDPEPLRHQVAELLPIEADVIEYRLHRLIGEECGEETCGQLPAGVSRSAFGLRFQAVMSLLTADLFGLTISMGMVCKLEWTISEILGAPGEELREYVRSQDTPAAETSWRKNRSKAWIWVAVTQVATVFTIASRRGAKVIREMIGENFNRVLTPIVGRRTPGSNVASYVGYTCGGISRR